MLEIYCSQCQKDVEVKITEQGVHHRGECLECGKFLKFVPHEEPTFHFGKYQGKTMADVAKEDRGYLEWWLTQDIKSNKMRRDIEQALLNG